MSEDLRKSKYSCWHATFVKRIWWKGFRWYHPVTMTRCHCPGPMFKVPRDWQPPETLVEWMDRHGKHS